MGMLQALCVECIQQLMARGEIDHGGDCEIAILTVLNTAWCLCDVQMSKCRC